MLSGQDFNPVPAKFKSDVSLGKDYHQGRRMNPIQDSPPQSVSLAASTEPNKVKLKLFLCFNWAPRHEGVLEEWRYNHAFLTSALDGGKWSASRPGRFTHRERAPGTNCIGRWVSPRAGGEEKNSHSVPGLEHPTIQPCTTELSRLLVLSQMHGIIAETSMFIFNTTNAMKRVLNYN
jgi:hypothetical protein